MDSPELGLAVPPLIQSQLAPIYSRPVYAAAVPDRLPTRKSTCPSSLSLSQMYESKSVATFANDFISCYQFATNSGTHESTR